MKSSEIFLEAAQILTDEYNIDQDIGYVKGKHHRACCDCIRQIRFDNNIDRDATKELDLFKVLFYEESKPYPNIYWYWWHDPNESTEDQEARRLALLFAAEVAKDLGD